MSSELTPLEEFARLGEVTIELRAELDRTVMSFADVAALEPGSVIRLPSSAGETVAIFCGDLRIGSGEVLVVDGALTVRVSDLLFYPPMGDASGRLPAVVERGEP